MMRSHSWPCAMLMGLLGFSLIASAQDPASKDLYSLDLESLLNLKVSTASKFSESLSAAPGVITVVTQEELNRFGRTTLPERSARENGAQNPQPRSQHMLSANFRLGLSRYLRDAFPRRVALVAHGEGLTGHAIWLPNVPDMPTDFIFASVGERVYAGFEFSVRKD